MAYKYFTKRLLKSNLVDLNSVFPEKQLIAREQNNVAYGLADIADYLRTATEEFKFSDQKYIDIDNAIRAVVSKYFTSKNEANPFDEPDSIVDDAQFQKGNKPREAGIVNDGKIKGKGTAKPEKTKEVVEEVVPAASEAPVPLAEVAPVSDEVVVPGEPEVSIEEVKNEVPAETPVPSQVEIKDAIDVLRFLADDGDQSAIDAIEALELLLEE